MNKSPDTTITYLRSVHGLNLEIKRCQERIKALRLQAENITSNLSGMPRSGNADSERLLACLADEEVAYGKRLIEAERQRQEVENFIMQVADAEYRTVLLYRYVDCLQWRDILERMKDVGAYYEERTLYNIHGRALNAARELWEVRNANT